MKKDGALHWSDYKVSDLMKLKDRDWHEETTYDSVLVVPTGRKHSSGYAHIAIIGVRNQKPIEIAAYPDDIHWFANQPHELVASIRTDCSWPHRVLHFWSRECEFVVGGAYSSTDIKLVPIPK